MRPLMLLVALSWLGCAHHARESNLAQRPAVTTPRGDFEGARKRDPAPPKVPKPEPPIVTPPVP